MSRKMYMILSFVLMLAFVLTACGSPATQPPAATEAPAGEPVTITWWHITTKDPGLSDWQKMADDYMAAHPNVTIEITVLENEAFKTKLTTVLQSGDPRMSSRAGVAVHSINRLKLDSSRTSAQISRRIPPGAIALHPVPWAYT